MAINFETVQRATISVLGALTLAVIFVGTAIGPAEAAVLVAPVL